MTIYGWLPLKEHSTRCVDKNWRTLGDRPLFAHIIDTMQASTSIEGVIVNVDTDAAADRVSEWHGDTVHVTRRPERLMSPTASTVDLFLEDMAGAYDDEVWLLTHCTTPFVRSETLDGALQWFTAQSRYDSVISVSTLRERLYDELGRAINHNVNIQLPLQNLPPVYVENNAFFIVRPKTAQRQHNRIGMRPYLYEIADAEAVDIDTEHDFRFAEWLYANR